MNDFDKHAKVLNAPLRVEVCNEELLSPLRLLHNEYSEWRLLYLYAAEAVQLVTKDASKNRSSAFFLQPSGRFVFSAGLAARHPER